MFVADLAGLGGCFLSLLILLWFIAVSLFVSCWVLYWLCCFVFSLGLGLVGVAWMVVVVFGAGLVWIVDLPVLLGGVMLLIVLVVLVGFFRVVLRLIWRVWCSGSWWFCCGV